MKSIDAQLLIAGGCTYSWALHINTNFENGEPISGAITIERCQLACINNASCTGFYWVHPSCFIGGPWSGQRNRGTAWGYTQFDLTRNCAG